MEVKEIEIEKIKPYKNNTKKHPDYQVGFIENSIKEFGFRQPLVLDKNNVVVIGHGRLLAAKNLEMESVPCVYANDLTEAQIKALRLADNKTNEIEWDLPLLDEELFDIDLDMSDFGFDSEADVDVEENIREIELRPYNRVHYLISLDIDDNPKILEIIEGIKLMEGVEIESTLN